MCDQSVAFHIGSVMTIKNRSKAEKSILSAVTDIVRERDFSALGVNAVA